MLQTWLAGLKSGTPSGVLGVFLKGVCLET